MTDDARLFDLTQPLGPEISAPPGMPAPRFKTLRRAGVDRSNVTEYSFISHIGTHMDAPFHYFPDGKRLDEIELERFNGPGYVVPMPLAPLEAMHAADLEPYLEEIAGLAFVFFSYRWAPRYGMQDYFEHPYIAPDAAEAIVSLRIGCIGIDAFTPDVPMALRDDAHQGPIHRILLGGDVLIIENLRSLVELEGRHISVSAFPMLIVACDGAPVRVVARLAGVS